LGLGIHGEQGVRRVPMQPADAVVETLLGSILEDGRIGSGERVALMVNGLGGTPPMELAIVARRALALLRERGVVVERAWSGTFLSALEMPGCSLTLLRVDDARLGWLDAASSAPAWPGNGRIAPPRRVAPPQPEPLASDEGDGTVLPGMERMRQAVLAVAQAFEAAEARLTELDSAAGDGDLGLSLARGAVALRALPETSWTNPSRALMAMSKALRRSIGGSSGPFYATALVRAARRLSEGAPDAKAWAEAFHAAVEAVAELGGARPGDRTMVDALRPGADAFLRALEAGRSPSEAWAAGVEAAERGAEATATMRPRLGRASYLGERTLGIPDAGAAAVVIWMQALRGHIA
jgi:dihydroxyacetone kinase